MHLMHDDTAERNALKAFREYQIARARVASRAAALAPSFPKEKYMARQAGQVPA